MEGLKKEVGCFRVFFSDARAKRKKQKLHLSKLTLVFLLELARQVALDKGGLACWLGGGGGKGVGFFVCLFEEKVGVEKNAARWIDRSAGVFFSSSSIAVFNSSSPHELDRVLCLF